MVVWLRAFVLFVEQIGVKVVGRALASEVFGVAPALSLLLVVAIPQRGRVVPMPLLSAPQVWWGFPRPNGTRHQSGFFVLHRFDAVIAVAHEGDDRNELQNREEGPVIHCARKISKTDVV